MHQDDTRKAHTSKTQNPRWSIFQNDVFKQWTRSCSLV